MTILLVSGITIRAQNDEPDAAPPPIKLVPKDDKEHLAGEPNIKERTKVALTLMDFHLTAAEKHSASGDATAAFRELGNFEALIDDSLAYLNHEDVNNGKVLDAFRKLEIGLRPFMARLEGVRRVLPLECDEYLRSLMQNLRDARAKAVDPLFSDNVVKTPGD